MFVLAHLSDPHLGPLPPPRWRELLGKRATGFINWRRKRHLIHRGDVLARIVADLKAQAPDHIAVSGERLDVAFQARAVYTTGGECRLQIGDEHLHVWQVARLALEEMFFDA